MQPLKLAEMLTRELQAVAKEQAAAVELAVLVVVHRAVVVVVQAVLLEKAVPPGRQATHLRPYHQFLFHQHCPCC